MVYMQYTSKRTHCIYLTQTQNSIVIKTIHMYRKSTKVKQIVLGNKCIIFTIAFVSSGLSYCLLFSVHFVALLSFLGNTPLTLLGKRSCDNEKSLMDAQRKQCHFEGKYINHSYIQQANHDPPIDDTSGCLAETPLAATKCN